jgi:Fic-DOC domain mobile mystery protein B
MGKIEPDAFGRVPGETPIDPSKLRASFKWVKTRAQLADVEAQAVADVHTKYLTGKPDRRSAPFTLKWMLKVNKMMFGRIWTWGGKRRQIDLEGVGSRPYNIEPELVELLRDIDAWTETSMPVMEQGTRLHHRAVLIHPFENGNGRWARLLSNIWLKQHGGDTVSWPDTHLVGCTSEIREEYIACLKAADAGDIDPLIQLHQRYSPKREGSVPN